MRRCGTVASVTAPTFRVLSFGVIAGLTALAACKTSTPVKPVVVPAASAADAGAPQGFVQQRVGPLARRFGHDVVRCVEIHGIDFRRRHELAHFHHAGTGRSHLVQFAVVEYHVAVLVILEAFDQLGAGRRAGPRPGSRGLV